MKSRFGLPGADDPAYEHELAELDRFVVEYQTARAAGDFDVVLFICGKMLAQHAAIYKLSPPAGLLDPADLFAREGGAS